MRGEGPTHGARLPVLHKRNRGRGCGWAFAILFVAVAMQPLADAQDRAAASPSELKLSTAVGPAYALGRAGAAWAALIRERSGGRIAVKHQPGATLVGRDATREFAALRDGAMDLAVGSSSVWSAQIPELNLLALPWLIPDEAALDALLGGDVGARLTARVEAAGVVPLLLAGNGFTALATKAPVRKPGDLSGLNIRTPASPLVADTLAALGAASSAMSLADARVALARGALDGQEVTVPSYAVSRLDVAGLTHLLLWDAHADALIFAVARARWDAWNEGDRELVRRAANDAAQEARAFARRSGDAAALATLARQGSIVTRLTPAGKDAFRLATRPVYERWAAVVGADLVPAAEAAIGRTAATTPK
jgi:TRAP-type C4-dicarboxylate transport system substrate-binding protein